MKGYGKFLDGIEKIEKLFLAVTVAIMIIVITYQVILRYVFSASNAWSEELARYLFIYDVMVAAAIATRRNSHLQVDAFIGILKPRTKAIYTVIATIILHQSAYMHTAQTSESSSRQKHSLPLPDTIQQNSRTEIPEIQSLQ